MKEASGSFQGAKIHGMQNHELLIKQCYQLAKQAIQAGNHPFGALLWVEGEVVLTQQNQVNSTHDNTRHAELGLLQMAAKKLSQSQIQQATLYTSTEPCAMCAGAIYWSGISQVVFGCSATSLGQVTHGNLVIPCQEIFSQGRRPVKVIGPILEAEGLAIHHSFW